ncbi:MAG TPA: hypothetical protein VGB55_11955 [Tepidisphaeraceae bacterium]|jgi:hypothetical protein
MLQVHNGQCGLCIHFGEDHPADMKLVQIRTSKKAEETVLENCGHPKHAPLNLKVTPSSSCEGFSPAMAN